LCKIHFQQDDNEPSHGGGDFVHDAAAGRDFKRDATGANSTAPNGQGKGPSVFFNSEDQ